MFTVRQQYVKPLEVIWAKCASLGWGPHNTVHVDDLERNFEFNKQSGVLISPFHLKPFTVHACEDGESPLDGTAQTSSPATVINDFEGSPLDNAGSPMRSLREREKEREAKRETQAEAERHGDSDWVDPPDECDEDPESRPIPLSESESESGDSDDVTRNKSFEDIELQLLSR